MSEHWNYQQLKEVLASEALPCMVVDLDVLDKNTERLGRIAAEHNKVMRVASKSVRVPALLKRICESGGEHFRGLMCFCVPEARLLAEHGFDDLLVAYPTVQESDLAIARDLSDEGRKISLMIDSEDHIERLSSFWAGKGPAGKTLRVCIDLDMSYRRLGRHLGTQRSPLRSIEDFARIVDAVLARPQLKLAGVMGYEALIAGVGDESPFAPLLNPVKKALKQKSIEDVAVKRRQAAALLREREVELEFFNGGGTGSIRSSSLEDAVTEVTAGSGFLQSHLFDYYAANENQPAFCFALQVTRIPQADMATCQSGGFIASGEAGPDKAPVPFLPEGLKCTKSEAFGEVQTPLHVPEALRGLIKPGDPLFFRPAKAGEIAERFNYYLLKSGDRIVDRVKTYRGLGYAFY